MMAGDAQSQKAPRTRVVNYSEWATGARLCVRVCTVEQGKIVAAGRRS